MRHRVLLLGLALVLLLAVAVAFIAAYPATVAGVDPISLGRSVQAQTHSPPAYSADSPPRCRRRGHRWMCERYLVDVDWRGCWTARQFVGPDDDPSVLAGGETAEGCVALGDQLGWP